MPKANAPAGAAAPAESSAVHACAQAPQHECHGWPADQYTGQGGTYIRDPITGQRTPVPAEPDPQP